MTDRVFSLVQTAQFNDSSGGATPTKASFSDCWLSTLICWLATKWPAMSRDAGSS